MDKSKIFKENGVYTKPYSSKYDYFIYGKYNIVLGTKEEIEDLELELFSQFESYDSIPFRFDAFEKYGYETNPKLFYVECLESNIYRARFYFDNENYRKEIEKLLTLYQDMKWYYFDELFSLECVEYFIKDSHLEEKHFDFDIAEYRKTLFSYSLFSVRREFKNLHIEIIEKEPNRLQLLIMDYLKKIAYQYELLEEDYTKISQFIRKKILKEDKELLYLERRNFDKKCTLQEEMYYLDTISEKELHIKSHLDGKVLKEDLLEDKIFFLVKKELYKLVQKYNNQYQISIEYLDSKPHFEIFDNKELVDSKKVYLVNKKFESTKYKEWLDNYFEKSYCFIKGMIDKKNNKIICYILYSKYIHNDFLVISIEDIGISPQYQNDIDYLQFFSKDNLIEIHSDNIEKSFYIEQLKIAGYKEDNGFFQYEK